MPVEAPQKQRDTTGQGKEGGMRLMTFRLKGDAADFQRIGIVTGDAVADMSARFADMADMLQATMQGAMIDLSGATQHALGDIVFLPPTQGVGRVFCIGLNYGKHVIEAGRALPDYPSIFMRFHESQVGHEQGIVRPTVSHEFDFEGELAFVIGRGGRRIAESAALAHVAGYTCFEDNAVRDWQRHAQQATAGKNFARSGAAGPWIVTPDEAPALADMAMTTRLNGEVMQSDTPGSLIFPVERLIAYISSFTPLHPGDLIATGSPEGVGATRDPQVWMTPGDRLEVEISGIGTLSNTVVAE